jgi:predicted NUDIX family NTP pyrophosphohydrolase
MARPARTSAGLLMFRRRGVGVEVLLAHPGGPWFRKKDAGAWSIPKGELEEDENPLDRAKIEFREEIGLDANGEFLSLGTIRQAGGKVVEAWAVEGDLPANFELRSNHFDVEWPPRSAKWQSFPEVDRAEFFADAEARLKINAAQAAFLDRLRVLLSDPA